MCVSVRACVCVFSSLAKASSAGDEEEAMDTTPGLSNEFAIASSSIIFMLLYSMWISVLYTVHPAMFVG